MIMVLDLTNKNIMVVDDDELNWLLISEILSVTGAQLFWIDNGYAAIDYVQQGHQVDLILMDIRLPRLDGYETTKTIKTINPSIPIIAQTAYAETEDEICCRACGCDEYISKPLNIDEFIDKAVNVLQQFYQKK
jgi:CheY-like chemotaxis protein